MGTISAASAGGAMALRAGMTPAGGARDSDTTTSRTGSSIVPIGGGTAAQQASLKSGLDLIATSPTGRAALEAAAHAGVRIEVTTDADYADYASGVGPHGTLRINPDVLKNSPEAIAGVVAHETGHALVDHRGYLPALQGLPDNLGTLANEVVAESLSSAIAKEAGYSRGQSAITRADGTLRSPAQGLDNILTSDFYLKYYKIDPSKISDSDFHRAYDQITTSSLGLIKSLGGTPPTEYTANSTRTSIPLFGISRYHWSGPKEATVAAAHVRPAVVTHKPATNKPVPTRQETLEAFQRAIAQMLGKRTAPAATRTRGPR